MKKFLIPTAAAVAAAALGTPYYLGIKAEESLTAQQKLLQESGFLTVESRQYERGWFTSTETTVIRLKPTLLHNTEKYLPDNLKTVLQQPVTIVNHIKHGPFAGGVGTRAYIETEFKYHPEAEKVLSRFFGGQTPVNMTNTVYFNGSGEISLNVPAFDYEELSGIKLNWKGLGGTTAYGNNFDTYRHDYLAPALQVKLADKGDIAFNGLHFQSETTDGSNRLSLGKSSLMLDNFLMQWKEGIDYNVKLNELVNLVTDLQIGAFINPTGTVAPSKIEVGKLKFATDTREADRFINSEGRFQFEKLAYGNEQYGPLDIHIAAEHLDAPSLLALKNKLAEIAGRNMSESEIQNTLIQTAKTEASGLFTQDPVLNVKTFTFSMPQGEVDVKGSLAFKGLTVKDMDNLADMLGKTHADFDIRVPQKMLEQLAVNQARSIFSVNPEDEAAGRANIDDINETLRLMVDNTLQVMARDQYLTLDKNNVRTRLTLQDNTLKLNGKVLERTPEPEIPESDLLPEDSETQAAQ
ncbi:YdgA family protein [Neisseria sp. ZJ106]|uniref:YdgA family protein n=1 Tax=Neisseria lisongii TaxID=2912188 RepID=A0ABY7RL28_9NEIS|nr:YdgA family protein [Neisseria lisongii]MCF7521130.1 YdgA family protein [Neisseria lisongii]WCL72054.1 YdgA family protein [Neisseria lisongii]